MTYFNNRYIDRIGTGGTPGNETNILLEQNLWLPLINRNPTTADYEKYCTGTAATLDLATCLAFRPILIDFRYKNISLTRIKGMDMKVQKSLATSRGSFDFSISGTRNFKNDFALATTTPTIDILNHVGGPLSLRLFGTVDWTYRKFGVRGAVSHTPSYSQPFGGPNNTLRSIAAWTTLDLGLSYRSAPGNAWKDGIGLVLNAVNVFDRNPPYVNTDFGYDPANANPYGRMLSLEAVKSW